MARGHGTSPAGRNAVTTELGAIPTQGGTRFALWSTTARSAAVRLYRAPGELLRTEPLLAHDGGLFERELPGVSSGALYQFVLDDRELPDPYARFLPFGVDGPARVEPRRAPRAAGAFEAPGLHRWVIYEMHVGTFTLEGTWRAARDRLDDLVRLGVNVIEVMPIAAFAGSRGWGYDGVALYAPFAPYGEPDDLCAFVSACHARGLAVVLDVVYNHFGPAGNYLGAYAPEYFTAKHQTPWGDAPDFTEPHLRRLVLDNARYWLEELDFDGLRLDATHAIVDDSPRHVLAELASIASSLSPKRVLIAEDERNDPRLVTSHHLDAIWADDFHHVLHTITTGERDGYYGAYATDVTELARTIERGWRYEGETYEPWKASRGRAATELDAMNLVYCVQNHDQIGNRAFGTRLHHEAGVDAHASAAMLLLFLPMVPLLFMGEEWAASTPFLYFTDFDTELGHSVTRGRREEFGRFRAFADPELRAKIPDPQARSTFESSRLRWEERAREPHARMLALYQRMLALRSSDPVLSAPSRARMACETHGSLLVVRRWLGADERVLLFNAGRAPVPTPLRESEVAERDVLATSLERFHPAEVPGRAAVLLRMTNLAPRTMGGGRT